MNRECESVRHRRGRLNTLRQQGNAYPNDFRRDALAGDLREHCGSLDQESLEQEAETRFSLTGRRMSRRTRCQPRPAKKNQAQAPRLSQRFAFSSQTRFKPG